jgi:hypothetical protein
MVQYALNDLGVYKCTAHLEINIKVALTEKSHRKNIIKKT